MSYVYFSNSNLCRVVEKLAIQISIQRDCDIMPEKLLLASSCSTFQSLSSNLMGFRTHHPQVWPVYGVILSWSDLRISKNRNVTLTFPLKQVKNSFLYAKERREEESLSLKTKKNKGMPRRIWTNRPCLGSTSLLQWPYSPLPLYSSTNTKPSIKYWSQIFFGCCFPKNVIMLYKTYIK